MEIRNIVSKSKNVVSKSKKVISKSRNVVSKTSSIVSRTSNYYKNNGLKKTLKRIVSKPDPAAPPQKVDLLGFWNFIVDRTEIPFSEQEYLAARDGQITVNWIVPEFGPGSGGHINIFRFISGLERRGIHNRVYVYRAVELNTDEKVNNLIRSSFRILDERVECYSDASRAKFAHATVATSWITAYFVRNFNNTISKFYFIQDFEPYFYARGSEYSFAENTYSFGFRGITAGDWLKKIVERDYGMKAESFGFSYDRDLYTVHEKKIPIKRIFFYARPVTPRRDWELGVLALEELCKRNKDVEIVFAGWDIGIYDIRFPHYNLGIVQLENLADLYASCEMCLIISSTNLSLLPLEVMGSGGVAVCSKGENSSWLVNEENAIMVDFEPNCIADTLEYYLNHPDELAQIRQKGIEFAKQTSWEKEADKVYNAILKGIEEDEQK